MKTIQTATKLWELLELAINDAIEIQKDPLYKLNMGVWHAMEYGRPVGQCHVCMAGAVMARELGAKPYQKLDPTSYHTDESLINKLNAINALRVGNLHLAYNTMTGDDMPLTPSTDMQITLGNAAYVRDTPWENDWAAHRALVTALKEADL